MPTSQPKISVRVPASGAALLAVQGLPPPCQSAHRHDDGNSKLPLTTWYLAIYLMTQSKTNIAVLAMMRQIGITWKLAWLIKHKLMESMRQREENQSLQGDVRVDYAYLGGERNGGKAGHGSENKVAFVAAVEMVDGRLQRVRFRRW